VAEGPVSTGATLRGVAVINETTSNLYRVTTNNSLFSLKGNAYLTMGLSDAAGELFSKSVDRFDGDNGGALANSLIGSIDVRVPFGNVIIQRHLPREGL
jgi:hypothetical protein